jgi:hypothetical protein
MNKLRDGANRRNSSAQSAAAPARISHWAVARGVAQPRAMPANHSEPSQNSRIQPPCGLELPYLISGRAGNQTYGARLSRYVSGNAIGRFDGKRLCVSLKGWM